MGVDHPEQAVDADKSLPGDNIDRKAFAALRKEYEKGERGEAQEKEVTE